MEGRTVSFWDSGDITRDVREKIVAAVIRYLDDEYLDKKGVPLPGLYPPNDENKAKYAAWRKTQKI
jgi:hypothetical protein